MFGWYVFGVQIPPNPRCLEAYRVRYSGFKTGSVQVQVLWVGDFLDNKLSNEKNLGWLGYIGDYTTQLYGDYNKPL